MSDRITCPNCGAEIELSSVMASEREKMQNDMEAELTRQMADKLKIKEAELQEQRQAIESAAAEKARKAALEESLQAQARLEELEKKVAEGRDKELEMLKREQVIKDREAQIELDIQKQLNEKTDVIRRSEAIRIQEEVRLKEAQKDKMISDLVSQVDDLKRRAEQGSQQLQGEVLELELEALLKHNFPTDIIEPVSTGVRGADVIQTVNSRFGEAVGKIVWESKQAKAWSKDWVTKLKDDAQKINAELAVIYTTILPKEIKNFGQLDGVWITDHASVVGLTNVLRSTLEEVDRVKRANEGGQEKAALVYEYIQSPQFRQKIHSIVETAEHLRSNLHRERRSMEKLWKEREKFIDKVELGLSGTYGELTAISGGSLEIIPGFELSSADDHENDVDRPEDGSNDD